MKILLDSRLLQDYFKTTSGRFVDYLKILLWLFKEYFKVPQDNSKLLQQLSKGGLSKETSVQGIFVQWQSARRQFSNETFVQGSFNKWKPCSNWFFLFQIEKETCELIIELKENNVKSLQYVKFMPWTKISLDKNLLGQLSLWQKSLGQLSPWTIIPWTIVTSPNSKTTLIPL